MSEVFALALAVAVALGAVPLAFAARRLLRNTGQRQRVGSGGG